MSKKFSIIFPTRERVELLYSLLRSIQTTTSNLSDIEVLIAVDEDDFGTQNFINGCNLDFVNMHIVKRSLNFSRDYYTYLAKHSTGRWIIVCNDDCQFETLQWDIKAYDVLKDKPGVIYGWIQDGIDGYRAKGHGNYCCFPLFGRKGYEALGYIFPADIPTWGADLWARKLYDQISSVVELPITIRHYCHHNLSRPQDEISKRIQENQVSFNMNPTYQQINILLKFLKEELVNK